MISLKEIGKICGLSESTVSKALKSAPGIRKATIERVKEVARLHGYQPNAMVECIQSGRSRSVGIAFNRFQCEFAGAIMEGIYQVLHDADYDSYLIPWDKLVRDEADLFAKFTHRRVDGLLLFPMEKMPGERELSALRKFHNPIVLVDFEAPDAGFDTVVSDNGACFPFLIEQLVKRGRRKIGLVSYSKVQNGIERKNAFLAAMKQRKLSVNRNFCVELGDCWNEAYLRVSDMLKGKSRPDALICFNDYVANDVLDAAYDLNLRVPEELSVIGFGNLPLTMRVRPRLATVEQTPYELGRAAAELLIKRITGQEKGPAKKIVIPTEFIKRESIE